MESNSPAETPGDRANVVAGIVLVSRGDGAHDDPDHVPHQQQLDSSIANLLAGGCDEVVVALGARIVRLTESSTTLYLPEWYNSLEETVTAAFDFAYRHPSAAGFVLQTIDAPDVGAVAVSRVLDAAGRRRGGLVRASLHGQWSQPIYVGGDLLDEAVAIVREHVDKGDDRAVLRSLGDVSDRMITVECGDLGDG